ncbi:hypothetical protein [Planococcus lenghuensis]|nr:hypothetical protein [Planococcus lenghuensis]
MNQKEMSSPYPKEFIDMLNRNLSDESRLLLYTLSLYEKPLNKEMLWKLANEYYLEQTGKEKELLSSRYVLDIHTARCEGAGLIELSTHGRTRLYMMTSLGKEVLEHARTISKKNS